MKPEQGYARTDQTLVSTTLGWRIVNPAMPDGWTVSLGEGAEILATATRSISREAQDEFALREPRAGRRGVVARRLRRRDASTIPGIDLERDEPIRPDTRLEPLASCARVPGRRHGDRG